MDTRRQQRENAPMYYLLWHHHKFQFVTQILKTSIIVILRTNSNHKGTTVVKHHITESCSISHNYLEKDVRIQKLIMEAAAGKDFCRSAFNCKRLPQFLFFHIKISLAVLRTLTDVNIYTWTMEEDWNLGNSPWEDNWQHVAYIGSI